MPACGRLAAKYNLTDPGQFVGDEVGQLPLGLPINIVEGLLVKTCIVAVRVLVVVRLAVKLSVIRFA